MTSLDQSVRKRRNEEFGRRLQSIIIEKGWNQSELARRAKVGRDAVSTYIRGIAFPGPVHLQHLADALGVLPADLVGNHAYTPNGDGFDFRFEGGRLNLRFVGRVDAETAAKVFALLSA